MVRELLAEIEPLRLTASPRGKLARRGKWSWLAAGLIVILIVVEHVFDLPKVSSFVWSAAACLLVAWIAYKALSGELGDETTRWQTSSIFIVATVGIGYALYISRQGREPGVEPASVMIAVLLGFCAANAYAKTVTRERGRNGWKPRCAEFERLRRVHSKRARRFSPPVVSCGRLIRRAAPCVPSHRASRTATDRLCGTSPSARSNFDVRHERGGFPVPSIVIW